MAAAAEGGTAAVGPVETGEGAGSMKIAVTSQGPDMTSEVDQRFGRAKFFVVVDTDTGESVAHDNKQNLNAAQGAGIQAARNVAALNVEALITGNVGPKAFSALTAANISIYIGATGSVRDAIDQLGENKLEAADNANVEGHWM